MRPAQIICMRYAVAFLLPGLLAGCRTLSFPMPTEVWVSTTNESVAVYRNLWSDAYFLSNMSAASVNIVLPRSALVVNEHRGKGAEQYRAASQVERSDEAESQAGEKAGLLKERVTSAQQRVTKDVAELQTSRQIGRTQRGELKAQDRTMERQSQTVAIRVDGVQTEREEIAMATSSQKKTSFRQAVATSEQQTTARQTTQELDQRTSFTLALNHPSNSETETKVTKLKVEDFFNQGSSHENRSSLSLLARAATTRHLAATSETIAMAITPQLIIVKRAFTPNVLPGKEVSFSITLTNTGEHETRDIVVNDPVPPYLTFLGIQYSWPERIFPFLRNITAASEDRFKVRYNLPINGTLRFTVKYRAAMPSVENPQEKTQDVRTPESTVQ